MDEQQAGAAILADRRDLVRGQPRIGRRHRDADRRRPDDDLDIFEAVRRQDRASLAEAQPEPLHQRRDLVRLRHELGKCSRAPALDQRHLVGRMPRDGTHPRPHIERVVGGGRKQSAGAVQRSAQATFSGTPRAASSGHICPDNIQEPFCRKVNRRHAAPATIHPAPCRDGRDANRSLRTCFRILPLWLRGIASMVMKSTGTL